MASPLSVAHVNGNGTPRPPAAPTEQRAPRRIVLLAGVERSEVEEVLLELHGEEVTGKRLHAEVQKLAAAHMGRWVAAEWEGPLGWTRFLWCKK